MKCTNCGGTQTWRPGTHRFDASGLPEIYLIDIPIWDCDTCGEEAVEIPNMAGLLQLLTLNVLLKPTGLTKEEIRFLRKRLGYSQEELADKLGVTRMTVTRWEDGRTFEQAPDKALRRLYVEKKGADLHAAVPKFLFSLLDGLPAKGKTIKRRIRVEDWAPAYSPPTGLEPKPVGQIVEQKETPIPFQETAENVQQTLLSISRLFRKRDEFIPIKGAVPPYGSVWEVRPKNVGEEEETVYDQGTVNA